MGAGSGRRIDSRDGVEVVRTISAQHHSLCLEILNRKTESVKLEGTVIVTSELSNREKIAN